MDARYWLGAMKALARDARAHGVRGIATSGLRRGAAPAAHILGLYPELEDIAVPMGDVRFTWSNMDPAEIYVLTAIIRLRRPRRIFELGTYDGATTLAMTLAAPDAEVWTIDLPGDASEVGLRAAQTGAPSPGVGYRHRGNDAVTQLYGDTQTFDFSPWLGTMDLVVVDAGHAYEMVHTDSVTALQLVRPGGVIIWDDYCPLWPDVVRAVDAVASEHHVRAVRIEGTDLAVIDSAMCWPPRSRAG